MNQQLVLLLTASINNKQVLFTTKLNAYLDVLTEGLAYEGESLFEPDEEFVEEGQV